MRVRSIHPWNLTARDAIVLQRELSGRLLLTSIDRQRARLIAGLDVSSSRDSPILTAGVVLWDRETGEIVDKASAQAPSPFPYIPGLLSFREIPLLSEALADMRTQPDVLMVDGQGIAHPRRLGIASHLGLLIDCPTIGVAKSRLCGTEGELGPDAGGAAPLTEGIETIGSVVRTKRGALPLYVSPGNRCTLSDAVWLTLACTRACRLPEPTRLAHLYANEIRKEGK